MTVELDEAAYVRAVEDFFAAARGVQHFLSTKDTHLVLSWWEDGVPLAAVTAAIAEVFARRRERQEIDPTVSLTYCRHAVKKQAAHLAAMRAGTAPSAADGGDTRAAVAALVAALDLAATAQRSLRPRVADLVVTVARQLEAAAELPPVALDDHLFSLASLLHDGCWEALAESERAALVAAAEAAAVASGASGEAVVRVARAMADRALRHHLGLPRLSLV